MDLERLLARLDRNPFESMAKGKTKPIYALSDPKVDSTFFNEKTWQGLVDLHKEIPGPVLIAGGLFDSCKYFFTKSEVIKFPRHAYRGGARETISDELKHKEELAVERLKQLGPNADIQYFYGPKDVKNIIELYNERINIYTTRIQAACKAMRTMQTQLEKLESGLGDIDEKYAKKRESEEKAYARGTPAMNKLRLRYIRRQLQTNRYNLKTSKGEETKKRLEEKIRALETHLKEKGVEDRDPIAAETRYNKKIKELEASHADEAYREIFLNAIHNIEHQAGAALRALDELSANLPCEELKGPVELIRHTAEQHKRLRQYLETAKQASTSAQRKAILREYNEEIGMTLAQSVASHSLNDKTYQMQKRDISKELRHAIIDDTKKLYKTSLEDLMSGQGGPKIKVHDWAQTATQINGAWVLATGFSGGFSDAIRQRNYSRMRQELFGQKTQGDWNDYIEDKELEQALTATDKTPEDFKLKHIDLAIAGNDNVYRWGPLDIDPDCRIERPTDVVTLAPFYDRSKARKSHNRDHIKADETRSATDPRATCGFLIIDHDKETTTRQAWIHPSMVDSTVKLARDAKAGILDGTINGINTSDDHPGQAHVRYENLWGTTALRLIDESIVWMDMLGDAYQGHNYRGTHTEGRTKIARLDDQAREYIMMVRECIKEIVQGRKSPLLHPIAYTIGNHDKPVETDFGIDMIGMLLEQLNLELENTQSGRTGLSNLTSERVCPNLEYKKTELGYKSALDKRPIRVYWSGHDGYGRRSYELKERKNADGTTTPAEEIGTAIICHKSIMGAGGDKMDPVHRVALYTKDTGRITDDIRELKAGHIHIPMVGNISDGINVCINPSSESMDKQADFPWATESIFGVMVGFTVPTGGAWKSYVSRDPNGPIFYEFMHLGVTRALYEKHIAPKIEEAWKTIPQAMKVNLTR